MSYRILHEKIKTARKEYGCAASEWICAIGERDLINDYDLSFADKRKVIKMRDEHYRIKPGDKYLEQVGLFEGSFYCVQCRLDVVEMCKKYDLYEC